MPTKKDKIQVSGGSVALLGDDQFRFGAIFVGQIGFVEIRAVDEEHHVRVLFDGARFAQVGELRLALFAFGSAGQLAEDHDRYFQFFGQAFQRARHSRNFFLAIALAAHVGGDNQLQVIHDNQRQATVAFQAPGLRAHFHYGGGRRIIHPQWSLGQIRQRRGNFSPIVTVHVAGAEFVGIDAGFRSEQAQQEGFFRHFQAENRDRLAITHRDIFRDVQRQRGFTHRRARGQDDQLGRLQAGRFVVEIGVTGSEAGDAAAFAENLFEALEIIANQFFDANQAGFDAIFGESENHRLGAIEDHIGIVARGQGLLLNGRRRENQAAQNRFFFDDARVVFDVGDARQAVSELREVGDAARRFQFAAPGQVLHQGHDIDGLLPFAKLQHAFEDLAVLRKEKILGFDLFHRGVQCMVIQQDRAEDAAFGFEVMRQRFFEGDIARHFVFELFSRMNLTILHPCPISSKRHRDGYVVYNFGKVEKCADRCQESKGKRKGRPRLRGAQNLKTTVRTYSSFLTVSLTLATTSRCNFTGISYSPTALMGSTSTIFFLSIS